LHFSCQNSNIHHRNEAVSYALIRHVDAYDRPLYQTLCRAFVVLYWIMNYVIYVINITSHFLSTIIYSLGDIHMLFTVLVNVEVNSFRFSFSNTHLPTWHWLTLAIVESVRESPAAIESIKPVTCSKRNLSVKTSSIEHWHRAHRSLTLRFIELSTTNWSLVFRLRILSDSWNDGNLHINCT